MNAGPVLVTGARGFAGSHLAAELRQAGYEVLAWDRAEVDLLDRTAVRAAVSGAAVRYRLYAHWGLTPLQIGKVIVFCSLTFGFGALVLAGGIPSASTGPALTARKPRAASEAIIAVFLRKYPFLQVWVSRSIEHMPGRLSPLPELAREMVSPSALLYT